VKDASRVVGALAISLLAACGQDEPGPAADAIPVGVALPFTGREASSGRNLEQALLLAVEDVNAAGGIGGRPLALESRDSNSGSERGFNDLLELLYSEGVKYLIGPEETELATQILPDIKGLDVFNLLPGYAAPTIERVSTSGAWLRLAPSSRAIGCAMAKQQIQSGTRTANAIVSPDDFNSSLAAAFNGQFGNQGGILLPSITVRPDATSYLDPIQQAFRYGADRTLLIAYPAIASTIVTEWEVAGRPGSWDLSPMLHAQVFLQNTPFGALHGYSGLSPSLSLPSECQALDPENPSDMTCARDNADAFIEHFVARWDGDRPLPAAHFYYDALVLLAMGLQYGLATDGELPTPTALQRDIRRLSTAFEQGRWGELPNAFQRLAQGAPVRYVGAAAEYSFDVYGAAVHTIFDTWTIDGRSFVDTGPLMASCPRNL
jgi:hypothetical protein